MKFLIILKHNDDIEKIKQYANKYSTSLIFDADKSYAKFLNSIMDIFYRHCEAQFLFVCTKYFDVAIQINHMIKADRVIQVENNTATEILHLIYDCVSSTGERGIIKSI